MLAGQRLDLSDVGREALAPRASRASRRPLVVGPPEAADDPLAGRKAPDDLLQFPLELLLRGGPHDVELQELGGGGEVDMVVVETGSDESALQRKDARGGPPELQDLLVGADRGEALAPDGDGPCRWARGIAGPDPAAMEDKVRGAALRRVRARGESEGAAEKGGEGLARAESHVFPPYQR
jgi:hypothetical protein